MSNKDYSILAKHLTNLRESYRKLSHDIKYSPIGINMYSLIHGLDEVLKEIDSEAPQSTKHSNKY